MRNYGMVVTIVLSVAELSMPLGANGKGAPLRRGLSKSIESPAELVLNVNAGHSPLLFTVGRLARMTRSSVPLAEHNRKRVRMFEGVDISWLIFARHEPSGEKAQVTVQTLRREGAISQKDLDLEAIEVYFGLFHKRKIPASELDADTQIIVVDSVDGKTLTGYVPYRLIIETGQGRMFLFNHVTRVSARRSP